MTEKLKWATCLYRLVKICTDHGIKIKFKRGVQDVYIPDKKTININSNRTKEFQVYVLLHEFGHYLIDSDSSLQKKFEPVAYSKKHSRLKDQVLILEEEVLAWHLGEQTAEKHWISIGPKYMGLKSKCLKAHVKVLTMIHPSKKGMTKQ